MNSGINIDKNGNIVFNENGYLGVNGVTTRSVPNYPTCMDMCPSIQIKNSSAGIKQDISSNQYDELRKEIAEIKEKQESGMGLSKSIRCTNTVAQIAMIVLMLVLTVQACVFAFVVYKFNIDIAPCVNWILSGISIFTVVEIGSCKNILKEINKNIENK